jgi:hypothetical protein
MIRSLWGVDTTNVSSSLNTTVGVTMQQLVKADPKRLALTVFNLSANNMYIAPGEYVDSNNGFLIPPNGGSGVFQWETDLEMVTRKWMIISAAANSNIYTQQILII